MNGISEMNEVDNRIYNYYNNEFNRRFDENMRLRREIMTKDRMIMLNNADASKKDILIDFFMYLLYIALFSFFGLLIYAGGFISWRTYLYFVLAIICLYSYYFLTDYYWNNFQKGARRAEEETANVVRVGLKDIIGILFPSYVNKTTKCPAKCKPRHQSDDLPIDDDSSLTSLPATDLDYIPRNKDKHAIKNRCRLIPGDTVDENSPNKFKSYLDCSHYLQYEDDNN